VRKLGPGRARILMPLHYPDAGALSFSVLITRADGDVTLALEVNGRAIAKQAIEGEGKREIVFKLEPDTTRHGINELFVTVDGGTLGFERMDILDRTPTPADRQRERDAVRR